MPMWVFFFDHDHFSLDRREAAARFFHALQQEWLQALSSSTRPQEWFLLETCYRAELYGISSATMWNDIRRRLEEALGWPVLCLRSPEEVFERLALIAAGALSPTVGEPQVAHQVKEAYRQAQEYRSVGRVLSRMVEQTLHCAHRIRQETRIQDGHVSVPAVVAEVVIGQMPPAMQPRVFILGTGEMAQLTLKYLVDAGYNRLVLGSRDAERAAQTVRPYPGVEPMVWSLEVAPSIVETFDVIVSASAAPHYLWIVDDLAESIRRRAGRSLLWVDLAFPRDVDPALGELPGVRLLSVDDLKALIQGELARKQQACQQAQALARAAAVRFARWLENLQVEDLARAIHRQVEAHRQAELARLLRKHDWTPREQALLDQFSHRLVGKLLHPVFAYLRGESVADSEALTLEAEVCPAISDLASDPSET
ncbi:MAG: glutamyl-tRNA reductase [Acidobacteria bacterium]|nr:glutamyl-tRNA reductase [Acidobacteriota bacterium]MDW7983497.1 glutamyl-tRNA reductase [Acidobacteriota bacterium]